MLSKNLFLQLGSAVLTIAALSLSACDGSDVLDPSGEPVFAKGGVSRSGQEGLLKSVRQATSRFHSSVQAQKAGYLADEHCVAAPGLGGMGHHWVNPSFVDGTFDPVHPEAVLYAPGPGGKLRLVAVEYIVLNIGQAAPSFAGQAFDVGGTPIPAPHWSLHVWLYEQNPSGTFAPFNPKVSCS